MGKRNNMSFLWSDAHLTQLSSELFCVTRDAVWVQIVQIMLNMRQLWHYDGQLYENTTK